MNRRNLVLGAATAVASFAGAYTASHAAGIPTSDTCDGNCTNCRSTCLACVAACLDEPGRKTCITLCLDCADLCAACDAISARKGPMATAIKALCAEACERCAIECEKHKDDEACAACAKVCRDCAQSCREALKAK